MCAVVVVTALVVVHTAPSLVGGAFDRMTEAGNEPVGDILACGEGVVGTRSKDDASDKRAMTSGASAAHQLQQPQRRRRLLVGLPRD